MQSNKTEQLGETANYKPKLPSQFSLIFKKEALLKKIIKQFFIFLIKIYQTLISPFLGAGKCRYYPSCSNYFIIAIEEKGLLKGAALGIWRILKCHPYSKGGFDPVK